MAGPVDEDPIIAFGLQRKEALFWISALAVVRCGGTVTDVDVRAFYRRVLDFRCKRCGRPMGAATSRLCVDCEYRSGGGIHDEPLEEPDLVAQMNSLTSDAGWRLENAFDWMRIQRP